MADLVHVLCGSGLVAMNFLSACRPFDKGKGVKALLAADGRINYGENWGGSWALKKMA
jgi:hypothetical protein